MLGNPVRAADTRAMTDHGHPLRFGVAVDPSVPRLAESLALAEDAESAGLDFLAVQDHPYQPEHLDTWTLLTALAMRTRRIGLFTDVADLQLRPPTMVAKAAASLAARCPTPAPPCTWAPSTGACSASSGGRATAGSRP